jgi:hypothetical protein
VKQISKIASNLIFWIPFAFAVFLSWQMLEGRETASPAFYSFLPTTFFFVGAAFMVLVKRIRRLENRVESQEIHDSSKPRSNEGTLFDDPTSWSLVASSGRYLAAILVYGGVLRGVAFRDCLHGDPRRLARLDDWHCAISRLLSTYGPIRAAPGNWQRCKA